MDWKTVLLEGVKGITSCRLQLYFKRRFGHLDKCSINEDQETAVLKFKRPQDAEKSVNTKHHHFGDITIEASWFCNQVILQNTDGITESRLKIFFGRRAGNVLEVKITDENKAIMTFKRHEDAKKVANEGTFNISDKELHARWILHEKIYVQVDGWPANTSLSRMKMYFGNQKRGGPIEELTEMDGHIIVEFKKESYALKVVNTGKYEINGTKVITSWYRIDCFKTATLDNLGDTTDSNEQAISEAFMEKGAVETADLGSQQPSNIHLLDSDSPVSSESESNDYSKYTPVTTPRQCPQHGSDHIPQMPYSTQSSPPPPPLAPVPPAPPPTTATPLPTAAPSPAVPPLTPPSAQGRNETTGNISAGGDKQNVHEALQAEIINGNFKLRLRKVSEDEKKSTGDPHVCEKLMRVQTEDKKQNVHEALHAEIIDGNFKERLRKVSKDEKKSTEDPHVCEKLIKVQTEDKKTKRSLIPQTSSHDMSPPLSNPAKPLPIKPPLPEKPHYMATTKLQKHDGTSKPKGDNLTKRSLIPQTSSHDIPIPPSNPTKQRPHSPPEKPDQQATTKSERGDATSNPRGDNMVLKEEM